MKGYCVVEHKNVEIMNSKNVKLDNGRWACRGKDKKGHIIYRFIKKKK